MSTNPDQVYRASVAAIIVNDEAKILMSQSVHFRVDEWDFIKGGMNHGEELEDTLDREIDEEIGKAFQYEIIKKSALQIVYDWAKEHQERRGMRGQARISFWVKHIDGELEIDSDELREVKWVDISEFEQLLRQSDFTEFQIDILRKEYQEIFPPENI